MGLVRKLAVFSGIGATSFAYGAYQGFVATHPQYDELPTSLDWAISAALPIFSSFAGPLALRPDEAPEPETTDDEHYDNIHALKYAGTGAGLSVLAQGTGYVVGRTLSSFLP